MRLKIAIVLWFGCGGVAAASDRQVVVVLLLDVVDDVIDVDAHVDVALLHLRAASAESETLLKLPQLSHEVQVG